MLRGLDIGLSIVFAALALIPAALISLAIVLSSGRPVLYRGTRERPSEEAHVLTLLVDQIGGSAVVPAPAITSESL